MKYILSIIIWSVLLLGPAQAEQQYLNILPDIPVMEGLNIVPDSTVTFDKPDGRIAESAYFSETITAEDINAFYNEVLPQLGWVMDDQSRFIREQDQLTFYVFQSNHEAIIEFSVAPIPPTLKK